MTTFTLYWISADRQNSLKMGSFETRAAAEAAVAQAWAEMRAQGADEDQVWIDAGFMEIDEEKDDDDDSE